MRILMLGWEFPPFVAGGLGVACYGLTRALDRMGHEIIFILPKPVDHSQSSHVRLLAPGEIPVAAGVAGTVEPAAVDSVPGPAAAGRAMPSVAPMPGFERTTFHEVPASFSSPYADFNPVRFVSFTSYQAGEPGDVANPDGSVDPAREASGAAVRSAPEGDSSYGMDLIGDAERYARLVVALTRHEKFDVIHAHDWLTFPAGIMLAQVTGKPLVVQVHSTEFDRAGNNVNQRIFDIERAGMVAADRVLAVSQLTKSICVRRYGVAPNKVDVVYNGIEPDASQPAPGARIESEDKLVLFLGRITMQKGPEYFIAAAKRVLEKVPNVKFVLAGSGDMALRMMDLANGMGIGERVLFTGFLRGGDVEKVFRMADCYVMPSVSEPFGIAALEAISHDVPVIISKTSGASEVLRHVLKVDFWDTDEMANKIIAVLKFPALADTLRTHGAMELHRLTWDGAAERCLASYGSATGATK